MRRQFLKLLLVVKNIRFLKPNKLIIILILAILAFLHFSPFHERPTIITTQGNGVSIALDSNKNVSNIENFNQNDNPIENEIILSKKLTELKQRRINTKAKGLYSNNFWMINNRAMQYSSYIMKRSNDNYTFEICVFFNRENDDKSINKDRFKCLAKLLSSNNEIIELEIIETLNFLDSDMIVVCKSTNNKRLDELGDIALAIVFKEDYDKSIKITDLRIDQTNWVLPYEMIDFQLPDLINIPEKKIKGIAHCINFLYDISEKDLKKIIFWLNEQKSFGISHITFYDTNVNTFFHDAVYRLFEPSFFELKPFFLNYYTVCDNNKLAAETDYNSIGSQIKSELCTRSFYKYFKNPTQVIGIRWRQHGANANDCYRTMSKIYEFVSYFDYDEFIFPRYSQIQQFSDKKTEYTCDDPKKLCILQTMSLNFYDYLMLLIKENFKNNIENLNFVKFRNSIYMHPNYNMKSFFVELKDILKRMEKTNSSLKYPLEIKYHMEVHGWHAFNIEQTDLGYVKYLCDTYDKLQCIFEKVFLNDSLNSNYFRFIHFHVTPAHALGKSIHYTDNVYLVFTHYAIKTRKGSLELDVSANNNIVSHFREDFYYQAKSFTSSIRSVQIDIEYLAYILKKRNNVC